MSQNSTHIPINTIEDFANLMSSWKEKYSDDSQEERHLGDELQAWLDGATPEEKQLAAKWTAEQHIYQNLKTVDDIQELFENLTDGGHTLDVAKNEIATLINDAPEEVKALIEEWAKTQLLGNTQTQESTPTTASDAPKTNDSILPTLTQEQQDANKKIYDEAYASANPLMSMLMGMMEIMFDNKAVAPKVENDKSDPFADMLRKVGLETTQDQMLGGLDIKMEDADSIGQGGVSSTGESLGTGIGF